MHTLLCVSSAGGRRSHQEVLFDMLRHDEELVHQRLPRNDFDQILPQIQIQNLKKEYVHNYYRYWLFYPSHNQFWRMDTTFMIQGFFFYFTFLILFHPMAWLCLTWPHFLASSVELTILNLRSSTDTHLANSKQEMETCPLIILSYGLLTLPRVCSCCPAAAPTGSSRAPGRPCWSSWGRGRGPAGCRGRTGTGPAASAAHVTTHWMLDSSLVPQID